MAGFLEFRTSSNIYPLLEEFLRCLRRGMLVLAVPKRSFESGSPFWQGFFRSDFWLDGAVNPTGICGHIPPLNLIFWTTRRAGFREIRFFPTLKNPIASCSSTTGSWRF
jgi:hypothetical protein